MSRSRGAMSLTTVSPMRISPSVISSSPASILSAVDLPHPDGPTSTMNSVSLISRLRSLTARMPPAKRFVTWSKVTDAILVILIQGFGGTGGSWTGGVPPLMRRAWRSQLPAHPPGRLGLGLYASRATELRCSLLRLRVVDESAGPKLDTRQVLEPIGAPVRRVELDVQVGLGPRLTVGRRLVHRHHVRRGEAEKLVVGTSDAQQSGCE